MDKNIGGYLLSGLSWLGVGLSMQEGLQVAGAWLAVISATLSLLFTLGKLISNLVVKLKKAKKDGKITQDELINIKQDLAPDIKELKENVDALKDATERTGK